MLTRGRTGSTAIIDVLNKTKSVRTAEQELFLKHSFPNIVKKYPNLNDYPSTIPFELWKKLTHKWWRLIPRFCTEARLIKRYLTDSEKAASSAKVGAFGFKVLSNHFEETPLLKEILLARGYSVLYLKRNIPHQVISGMVAKQRGIYNATNNYHDNQRYLIDVEEFKNLVSWETQAVANDLSLLRNTGFKFIEVTYEGFMTDREAFFNQVMNFLGVPPEIPQASSYSVMIKDLKHTVENYQAAADCAAAMGMRIE